MARGALTPRRVRVRQPAERGRALRLTVILAPALCFLEACGAPLSTQPSNAAHSAHGGDTSIELVARRDASTEVGECPKVSAPRPLARVSPAEVSEASGLVQSLRNPGVVWIHNDSGDSGRVFAIGRTGAWRGTVRYKVEKPVDIEDMALMEDADGWSLLLGDIGDNPGERVSLRVHRFAEPILTSPSANIELPSESMTVTYEDGPHDAESLIWDPVSREIFVITKQSAPAGVFRVGPFEAGKAVVAIRLASVPIDRPTGADISRDGAGVLVRGYGTTAWLYLRRPGEPLASMFQRGACLVPVAAETQGEAIGFAPDGFSYLTISEGLHPQIFEVTAP